MKQLSALLLLCLNAAAQNSAPPTFSHDIAPLLYRNCASCHRPKGPAPFSLLTYEDAKKYAAKIAETTANRSMPPWLPEPGYGDFVEERRLNDTEIRMIVDWTRHGAPEGSASQSPSPPHFSDGWQLGTPDLILKADHPFAVPSSKSDVFWNFVFSPSLTKTRYVRAIEIRPGNEGMVHHANLVIDRTASARRLEAQPGAGFPGMELSLAHSPLDFPGHFLFWKPGNEPWVEPVGLSWRLDPGNDLVLNAHLMAMTMAMGEAIKIQPSIGLYFTDKPPDRFPLLIQLENDGRLDIPAGDRDFVVRDDFRLPMDCDVLAVYPHAHELGHLLEGYAALPNGERKWLIRIPDWDPKWQAVYHYRSPVHLPKGAVVSMRYHYDNSASNPHNPNHPPKRVQSGNQSSDEMGHLWLQVLPRAAGDHRRELEEAWVRHRLEKYPDDSSARVMLGALLLARLDPAEAVGELERAVQIAPAQPEPHNWLGVSFMAVGRVREGTQEFRIALDIQPGYADARYNLAKALAKSGELEEARQNFSLAVAAYPQNAQVHNDFGELLMRMGQPREALKEFNQAIALDPQYETARKNSELAQQRAGR
ncbi:MAG TPA: tetratricopeptide repeat protein [Terriglobales bacterium]|nr:tetratricopeptide repeat protein [Terriglobales bacterium]